MAGVNGRTSSDGTRRWHAAAMGAVGLCLTLLSLAWIGGLHRQADLVLFAQQPIALALALAIVSGGLIVMTGRPIANHVAGRALVLALAIATGGFFVWLAAGYQDIVMLAIQRPQWLLPGFAARPSSS